MGPALLIDRVVLRRFLQRGDQHGKIVYAFRYYSKLFGHADSLVTAI